MMGDPLLSVFPPPLLRLVLCGGGGLPAAWGPINASPYSARCANAAWHAQTGEIRGDDGWSAGLWEELDEDGATIKPTGAGRWRLPLDHWRARIEIVAAWMLGSYAFACTMRVDVNVQITFRVFELADTGPDVLCWDVETGAAIGDGRDLPTLPAHLLTHDPHIAILLSLFDVPEIRAKVEALNE